MDVRRQNPKSQITISGPQNPKSQMKTPPVTHFSGTSKSQIPTEKVGNGGAPPLPPPACPGVIEIKMGQSGDLAAAKDRSNIG